MAHSKISALTDLAAIPAAGDEFVVVDISDTTMASSGTNKRVSYTNAIGTELSNVNSERALYYSATSMLIHDQAAATLGLVNGAYAAANPSFSTATATAPGVLPIFRYVSGDHGFGLTGTDNCILRTQVASNATAPGTMTFIFGIYPVTVAGAADTITLTLGTVTGSQSTHTNPGASTVQAANSAAFTLATGNYCLGVVTNATIANNSAVQVSAQLLRYTT